MPVIVITGPGRSGTSFLARLYDDLGFSPIVGGGGWAAGIRGGLEDIEIGQLNSQLIDELGMRSPLWRLADQLRTARGRYAQSRSRAGAGGTEAGFVAAPSSPVRSLADTVAARTVGRHVPLLRWDRIPTVVERRGPEMRRLAHARQVVKDPAFCSTIRAWAAAGAEIDHVVVSLRATDVTASGLIRTGHLPSWARATAENRVAYRLGLLLAALIDYRLPYSIVRFPDYLADEAALCDALPFPEPVSSEQVIEAIQRLRTPSFVSSWK